MTTETIFPILRAKISLRAISYIYETLIKKDCFCPLMSIDMLNKSVKFSKGNVELNTFLFDLSPALYKDDIIKLSFNMVPGIYGIDLPAVYNFPIKTSFFKGISVFHIRKDLSHKVTINFMVCFSSRIDRDKDTAGYKTKTTYTGVKYECHVNHWRQ